MKKLMKKINTNSIIAAFIYYCICDCDQYVSYYENKQHAYRIENGE
ncbi:hypothetical protein [Abyssisolibacter fermentans]|nr:hypothetical protein [Abyssisolibacter fermentans]